MASLGLTRLFIHKKRYTQGCTEAIDESERPDPDSEAASHSNLVAVGFGRDGNGPHDGHTEPLRHELSEVSGQLSRPRSRAI